MEAFGGCFLRGLGRRMRSMPLPQLPAACWGSCWGVASLQRHHRVSSWCPRLLCPAAEPSQQVLAAAWPFSRAHLCQTQTHTPVGSLQAGGYKTRRLGHLERSLGEVQARASVALESRAGPAWPVLAPRGEPRGPPASPSLPRASSFPPSRGHSGPRVSLHLHIWGTRRGGLPRWL